MLQVGAQARNGLTPMHLCAQEDRVSVAEELVKGSAAIDPKTKAGYTPLHVACHFGSIFSNRFLFKCILQIIMLGALQDK